MRKLLLLISILITIGFSQDLTYNQEFQINTIVEDNQFHPVITEISNHKFVVCWVSEDQYGSGKGVHAQIFNSDFEKVGSEFRVNTYTTNDQEEPAITNLANGNFVVAWQSYGQDGDEEGIFAQIFDDEGNKVGSEFQVNTFTKTHQKRPSISVLFNGNFIVTWFSDGKQDGAANGVFAQIFNEDGYKIGSTIQVNTRTHDDQRNPSVIDMRDNRFVICWESDEQDGDSQGIFAQVFDYAGNKIGEEFQVNTYTSHSQKKAKLAPIGGDKFIVTWQSAWQKGWDSGWTIYGQIFNTNGEKIGNEFQINSYYQGDQHNISIKDLPEDKFIVCWNSEKQDGSGYGIYSQIFDSKGNKIGTEFRVNTHTLQDQRYPAVTGLSEDRFVICWQSDEQDGSGFGIYGKYYYQYPVQHNLDNFSLIAPAMDATIETLGPEFLWRKASREHLNLPWDITYNLYISATAGLNDPIIFRNIVDITFQITDTLEEDQTYFWRVKAVNWTYDSLWSSIVNGFYVSEDATYVKGNKKDLLKEFRLFDNYPNPFNPVTTIKYKLSKAGTVNLTVYNIHGRIVKRLVSKYQNAGNHRVNFVASELSSGIYFYKLQVGNDFSQIRKMMLIK